MIIDIFQNQIYYQVIISDDEMDEIKDSFPELPEEKAIQDYVEIFQ